MLKGFYCFGFRLLLGFSLLMGGSLSVFSATHVLPIRGEEVHKSEVAALEFEPVDQADWSGHLVIWVFDNSTLQKPTLAGLNDLTNQEKTARELPDAVALLSIEPGSIESLVSSEILERAVELFARQAGAPEVVTFRNAIPGKTLALEGTTEYTGEPLSSTPTTTSCGLPCSRIVWSRIHYQFSSIRVSGFCSVNNLADELSKRNCAFQMYRVGCPSGCPCNEKFSTVEQIPCNQIPDDTLTLGECVYTYTGAVLNVESGVTHGICRRSGVTTPGGGATPLYN
ncbi:MAG TPA: hypothetical protein VF789_05870 [Thermoanaerobaculia bacterium]